MNTSSGESDRAANRMERRIGESRRMAAAMAEGARHREGTERCGEQRRERPKQPTASAMEAEVAV